MRVTAIMNLKGGTAKTVTTINMAAILSRDYDKTVLLVDADSQANLTEFVSSAPIDGIDVGGLSDLLSGKTGFPMPTQMQNVKLLKADDSLMGLDVTKAGSGEVDIFALYTFLADYGSKFDHVLIDCPPAFSAAAMAALIAADDVIIPMKLDAFGVRGMTNLLEQVKYMRKVNADLTVSGILPTMFYPTEQMRKAEDALRASDLPVFPHIRRSTKVDDMTFAQVPLTKSSPRSSACRDYRRFVEEYLKGENQHGI